MDILFMAIALAFLLYQLKAMTSCKKPFKCFFIHLAASIISLFALSVVCAFLSVDFSVNNVTCAIAAIFGVPGVILLALNIFII